MCLGFFKGNPHPADALADQRLPLPPPPPQEWNPSEDKFLDVKYDKGTVLAGKAAAKAALQAELGLPVDPSVPLFGYIGRLEEQKGSDILLEALPAIAASGKCQVSI